MLRGNEEEDDPPTLHISYTYNINQEKKEKCNRATLQARRVCRKEDLISSKDRSHPSKHLASKYTISSSAAQVSTSLYCNLA